MPISKHAIIYLLLLLCLPLAADTKSYQTTPKTQPSEKNPEWQVPVISVDPATQKTRVYIRPDAPLEHGLASHNTQVYHALALYQPTQLGIQRSVVELHQKMADTCPKGWIKHQEWTDLQIDPPELHYKFQCLEQ